MVRRATDRHDRDMTTTPTAPDTSDSSPPAGPTRTRVILEVLAWILALGGVLVAWAAIAIDNHFHCGGTLGGFGESANARLDEACVDARAWRFAVPLAVYVGALALRMFVLRRRRTDARSRR